MPTRPHRWPQACPNRRPSLSPLDRSRKSLRSSARLALARSGHAGPITRAGVPSVVSPRPGRACLPRLANGPLMARKIIMKPTVRLPAGEAGRPHADLVDRAHRGLRGVSLHPKRRIDLSPCERSAHRGMSPRVADGATRPRLPLAARDGHSQARAADYDADLCQSSAQRAALRGPIPPTNGQQTGKRPDRRIRRSGP